MTDCQHDCDRRKAVQKELMAAGHGVLRVHAVLDKCSGCGGTGKVEHYRTKEMVTCSLCQGEGEEPGDPVEVLFVGRSSGDRKGGETLTAYVREAGEPAVVYGW